MTDNKLSELSKPVAWTSARSLDVRRKITAFTDVGSAAEYTSANCWEKIVPLYSQEYVSALLAALEAKDKRIAELEEEFSFIMGQNDGMEKELRDKDERIEHLEAKLALSIDVRKHYLAGYDDGHSRGLNAGRLYKADDGMIMHRHASANAYAVEGGE